MGSLVRRSVACVLLLAAGCTTAAERVGGPAPSSPVAPSPSPSSSPSLPVPVFEAARVVQAIAAITAAGPREATSDGYAAAAAEVAARFGVLGYDVRRHRFPVPAGRVNGTPVGAGESENVVATPVGFDLARPHIVVGGHLDTVPGTVGANDNASGVAIVLELARLARLRKTSHPIVFVAFGAEETRRPSSSRSGASYGARAYLAALPAAHRGAIRAAISLDMVGAGRQVEIMVADAELGALAGDLAARLRIRARARPATSLSDHVPFVEAGIPALWLWGGNHPTLHRPTDVPAVIEPAQLDRIGRLAWAMLRAVP